MTTAEPTNHDPTKKPRKGSKIAKRIADLEGQFAIAIANSDTHTGEALREKIARLESGQAEEKPGDVIAEDAPTTEEPPMTMADAAAQAAEHQAHQIEWDVSEETIDVKITGDVALDMLRANGADQAEKAQVDREIDADKAALKEKKAKSDAIAARLADRHRTGGKGVVSRREKWKIGRCFATNTAELFDPGTGQLVCTRALSVYERQTDLPLGKTDPTDVTMPADLLADAQKGDEPSPSDVTLDNDGEDDDEDQDETDDLDGDDEEDS